MTNELELYKKAIASYYSGMPIMSDQLFDALEDKLLSNHTIDSKIRFEKPNSVEVAHDINGVTIPLVSLYAMHTQSNFDKSTYDWMCNWLQGGGYVENDGDALGMLLKYDGMSCEATFIDGKLQKVVTKGNGSIGYDVTAKFVAAGKIPTTIKTTRAIQVRFEAAIDKHVFAKKYAFNEDGSTNYANERNASAGIVKSKNMFGMEDIDPIAYIVSMVDEKSNWLMMFTHHEDVLEQIGWNPKYIAKMQFIENAESFNELCQQHLNDRADMPYRIDGLVVRVCPSSAVKLIKIANNQCEYSDMIALKFDAKSAITKVTNIDWRQRINGELFPRIELEPVDLDGTIVKAASGFNWGFVYDNDIYPGSIVRIEKGGDIIPDIQECIEPGPSIELLPGEDLTYEGGHWKKQWGVNYKEAYIDGIHLMLPEEFARQKRFINGVLCLNVDGLGYAYAQKIYDAFIAMQEAGTVHLTWNDCPSIKDLFVLCQKCQNATDIMDFLTLDKSMKNDCKAANGLYDRLHSIYLCHWIECMQVPGIGSKAAYQLSAELSGAEPNYAGLERMPIEKLKALGEIQYLLKHYASSFILFQDYECNKPKQTAENDNSTMKCLNVVMTGSPKGQTNFATKGKYVDALNDILLQQSIKIVDYGANIDDCNVVLTNDKNHMSNKLKAALNAGKQILTYDELLTMANDLQLQNLI